MFDIVLENMEVTSLIKANADLDDVLDLLEKGLGHKYLRRIPTGQPGHPYRYVYNATHALVGNAPQVGEKVRLDDDENEGGHYEITKVHPNDHVTMKHDVTGHEMTVHKDTLRDMVRHQHMGAIEERHKALTKVHEQAMKTGTPRQQERASSALNAHNMAFNGEKYRANRDYADRLAGRVLNDKYTTTHQHHEAMGAHVVAANQAPSHEAREQHMAMVQKLSGSLDALKQKIAGDRADPNPGYTAARKKADEASKTAGGAKNAREAAAGEKAAADAHRAAAALTQKQADHEYHNNSALIHDSQAGEYQRRIDNGMIREPDGPSGEAKPADKIKEGVAAMAPKKSHDEVIKDFKEHFMGKGTRAPKALQRYDADTNKLNQKVVGDKETISNDEIKAGREKLHALFDMAKERGGKGKAVQALRDARDHWRYMAKLHNGRVEGMRYRTNGPAFGQDHETHRANMSRARGMRDRFDEMLQNIRLRSGTKHDPTAKNPEQAKDIREGDSDRVKTEKNIRAGNKAMAAATGKAREKGAAHTKLGAPHASRMPFFESTNRSDDEASGKQTNTASFNPDEHKDLPKGATLKVYAPNAPSTKADESDIHTYQHVGHGELKPLGDSSKHVNTLKDLKGHHVRVSEPGDTRTGDLFAGKAHGNEGETEGQRDARVQSANAAKEVHQAAQALKARAEGGGQPDKTSTGSDKLASPKQEHHFAETTGVGKAHSAEDIVSGKAAYKVGDHLSPLHDSKDHAYTIDDYPYGRQTRTQKRVWIEHKKGFGHRLVEQTKNPKTGGWNLPHPGQYAAHVTAHFDENGHLQAHRLLHFAGMPMGPIEHERTTEYMKQHGEGLKPAARNAIQADLDRNAKYGVAKSDAIASVKAGAMLLKGSPTAQKGAMMDGMKKSEQPERATTHVIKGRGVLMPQLKLGEPFAEHRPKMRAPVEDLVYFGAAPAVTGPNQGVVRSMAAARAKKEVEAAILGAYRAELMRLEAGNTFLQTVTKHSTGLRRPGVPAQMVKALNVGTPNSEVVVDKAVARLKVRAKEDAQVRQGLALMKLSKADVLEVFVGMGLTPERVYAGRV